MSAPVVGPAMISCQARAVLSMVTVIRDLTTPGNEAMHTTASAPSCSLLAAVIHSTSRVEPAA